MRLHRKKSTVLLALIAGAIAAGGPAVSASAAGSPGGASAPVGGTAAATPTGKIRPSAIATWFGPGFYGKKTACGQTLTPGVVGVANRTLPCGTLVKVTYSGHTLTVPVLDRGPYSHIADWDLTSGAASALGITETVRIHTRIVGSAPNTPSLGAPAATQSATVAGGALAG
jgi:rare lipoprotein A